MKMKTRTAILALLLGTTAISSAHAQYRDWEYNLDPKKYRNIRPSNPVQSNLAQIGIFGSLCTQCAGGTLHSYIAGIATDNGKDLFALPGENSAGVTIAILDGKVDITNVDLATFTQDPTDPVKSTVQTVYAGNFSNNSSHGTHVAGTAAANLNGAALVGVNPYAHVLSIPVFDNLGWVANDLGAAALTAAQIAGAVAVNMSYGSTDPGAIFLPGELNVLNAYNNMVLVKAGGNEGLYAKAQLFGGTASTDLRNLLLVGSVNANNQISSFSNKPGTNCFNDCGAGNLNAIANYWIVAPGENIWSDLPGDSVGTMSGTSMAAPHVTGAAALVWQTALAGGAVNIDANQVAEILKFTATDLDANGGSTDGKSTYDHLNGVGSGDGVDAVFGWGLLNVSRALQPLGSLTIPTALTITEVTASDGGGGGGGGKGGKGGGGRPFSLGLSSIAQNIAGLENALSGMLILDGYDRAFVVDSPSLAAPRPSITTENPLQRMFGLISATKTNLGGDGDYSVSLISGGGQGRKGFDAIAYESTRVRFDIGSGASFGYFTANDAADQSGTESFSRTMGDNFFTGSNVVSSPFSQSLFLGGDYRAQSDLTFSMLYVQSTPYQTLPYVPGYLGAIALKEQSVSSVAKLGARREFAAGLSIGASYGVLAEHGRALGMSTSGAFSLGGTTLTHMGDVNLNARLDESSALSVFAEQTSTTVGGTSNSLFGSAQTWRGSKFGVAFSQADIFGTGDFLKVKVTRSLQIDDGVLALHLPIGRALDGTVNFEDRYVPIGSNDNPMEVGFVYLRGGNGLTYGTEVNLMQDRFASGGLSDFSAVAALNWSF